MKYRGILISDSPVLETIKFPRLEDFSHELYIEGLTELQSLVIDEDAYVESLHVRYLNKLSNDSLENIKYIKVNESNIQELGGMSNKKPDVVFSECRFEGFKVSRMKDFEFCKKLEGNITFMKETDFGDFVIDRKLEYNATGAVTAHKTYLRTLSFLKIVEQHGKKHC